uniref:E3 ubiquitin-protein ligase n=1 Tax=Myripristis murdjan TaxID=586833 RepID=A0A667ZNE9_9TELE
MTHLCAAVPGRSDSGSDMDRCAVCLDAIQDRKTLKCLHSFCAGCIESVFKVKPACPICNTYHGVYIGTQPEGTMTVSRSWKGLPGFEKHGVIIIEYHFPSGIQGPEHPNPGVKYAGTRRTAFLPACEEGEKVLRLLRKAFERRLIFTVGRSATTGLNNYAQFFGYPDPAYLFRVQEELRLKGVTEDD